MTTLFVDVETTGVSVVRDSIIQISGIFVVDGEEKESTLVSINTATLEELMTLEGVGEAKAKSIIAYREEHGPYQAIEDLLNVSGIGESLLAKIKKNITL